MNNVFQYFFFRNNDTSAFKSEDQLHSFLVEEDDLGDNSVAMFSQVNMKAIHGFFSYAFAHNSR